jgi:hypothetical protein
VLSGLKLGNNYQEPGKLGILLSFFARDPGGEVFLMLQSLYCGIIAAVLSITVSPHNTAGRAYAGGA